ncbi:MAG TPA: hypothetical protein VJG67_04045 [Candidatus Paceibacterota bacterium]
MASNKTLTVFIICFGVVISTFLFQKSSGSNTLKNQGGNAVVVENVRKISTDTTDDWKKILVVVDPKTQGQTTILTKSDPTVFDDTTLTAQMSRDFLSQYLLAKRGGKTLTDEDKKNILQNLLTSPAYSKIGGPVYISSNLNITNQLDLETQKKYRDSINILLQNRSSQIKINPLTVINTSLQSDTPNNLSKIDPVITAGKGLMGDLLKIEVPKSAVSVHLSLLNSISNLVYDLETMRKSFSDPIISLSGMAGYSQHLSEFQSALTKINAYFVQKTGSTQ